MTYKEKYLKYKYKKSKIISEINEIIINIKTSDTSSENVIKDIVDNIINNIIINTFANFIVDSNI